MPLPVRRVPIKEFGVSVSDANLQLAPKMLMDPYAKCMKNKQFVNFVDGAGKQYQLHVQIGCLEEEDCPTVMREPAKDTFENSKRDSYSFPLKLNSAADIAGAEWLDDWLRRVCKEDLGVEPNKKQKQTDDDVYKKWLRRPVESDDPANKARNHVVFIGVNEFTKMRRFDAVGTRQVQQEDGTTVDMPYVDGLVRVDNPLDITTSRAVATLKLSHIDLEKKAGGIFYTNDFTFQNASEAEQEDVMLVGGVMISMKTEGAAAASGGSSAVNTGAGVSAAECFEVPPPPGAGTSGSPVGGTRRAREGQGADSGAAAPPSKRAAVPAMDTSAAVVGMPTAVTQADMEAAFE